MVLKKNKILFLIALVLFIMTAVFIYQYFFQIKKITFKTALNLAHRMAGKSEYPTRFNAQSPVLAREGIAIFTASSLDRIFSDGKTLLKPHFAASRSIFLARNEYESFQVVVQSKGREIHDVQLSFSDFVNIKAGTKINQRNLTWRVVGFVKTFEPYYPVKYIGLWPDPLLPPHKVNVKKNFTQPFWITFYASKDCLPGDYEGFVFIQSGSQILQSVPVKIHIYNFELPITSHLKTAFDFYSHMTKLRYLQDSHEADDTYQARLNNINDQYISTMLQYRMNPILNVDPSDQMELSAIDRYLVLGLNNFSIGKRGGTFNNNWPHTDGAIDNLFSLYRTYGEDLKLNGMLAYSYIYLWDEGKMGDPQVKKIA